MPKTQTHSWIGHVESDLGVYLLGGTRHHSSERFSTAHDAEQWCQAVKDGNEQAGRSVAATWIERSNKRPNVGSGV